MIISNKKKKQIGLISSAIDNIKIYDETVNKYIPGTHHWTDSPPDQWSDDEKALWDMAFTIEEHIKSNIINIINPTGQPVTV